MRCSYCDTKFETHGDYVKHIPCEGMLNEKGEFDLKLRDGRVVVQTFDNEEALQRLKEYIDNRIKNPSNFQIIPIDEVRVSPGRTIHEMIFCGSESYFFTLGQIYHCIKKAVELIGGLQQPPHSLDEETARMDEVDREFGWREVESYASDVVCGLLGPEYKIVKVVEKKDE
jgi:hypothetical protein